MGDHILLFIFEKKSEVDRVLQSEPWSFDKHLVVLQHYENDVPIHKLAFNKVCFWVQVHDIPVRFMNCEVAEKLCDVTGEVRKSFDEAECDGGGFMWVRVTVDINQPLCRGRVITKEDGGQFWISFKYKRLPNLCYWCCCLSNDDKDCDVWINSERRLSEEAKQFGPSLRAPHFFLVKNNVVTVPGF